MSETRTQTSRAHGRRGRTGRISSLVLVAVMVVGVLAALIPGRPSAAAAAVTSGGSITYVKDGNVWLTSPDGITKRQVTTDGTTASGDFTGSSPYLAPSQSGAGDVLVAARNEGRTDDFFRVDPYLWVMDRQGGVIRKVPLPQWLRQGSKCIGSTTDELVVAPRGVSDAVVSPDGTKVAYVAQADFFHPGRCNYPVGHSQIWVINIDGTGATAINAGTNDPYGPSWLTNSRLLLNDAAATLYFVDLPGTTATQWVQGAGLFPDQRAGKLATNGYINGAPIMRLWSSSGPPALPVRRCDFGNPAGGADGRIGDMSWAPDGGALVWDEGDGVPDETGEGLWIMAVGDIAAGCPPDPQAFIPGGFRPFWGPAPVNLPTLPTLAVNDVSVSEGDSGTRAATFTITRSGDLSRTSSVSWATANGTATAPGDYAAASGTATFAVNDPAETVTVTVNGDTFDEGHETFTVGLSAPVGATVADGTGVATIINDDAPRFTIGDVTVTEGNSGITMATFTVTRSGDTSLANSVNFATADGTATTPADYGSASGTLSFSAGETTKPVSVPVNGDTADEPNETFVVRLSGPPGIILADDTGLGTITNDDAVVALPTIAVNDVRVTEGGAGTTALATFTITRTGDLSRTSSVDWATANSTATAPGDYLAQALTTVNFAANEPTKTVRVTVNGDNDNESDERFSVRLSSPVGATIADGTGLGTIVDDDSPSLTINDVSVTEGNSGTKTATFTITRSTGSGSSSVKWNTADSTATVAGNDYVAQAATTVNFAATETTKTVSVTIKGDTDNEPNEKYLVRLSSPVGATVADSAGVGTITNDDAPSLRVNDVRVTEGHSGSVEARFTITRSTGSGTSSVKWNTADGTAKVADNDYRAVAATAVEFAPGETTKTVGVPVHGDTRDEADETFSVRLSAPTLATIADGAGVGTIVDDDPSNTLPTLAVNDVRVTEGNSGTTQATFTVTRSGDLTGPSSVDWATANGTATSPSDYVAQAPTRLDFAANQATRTLSVTVNGDLTWEPDEDFSLRLSAPSGATIADDTGMGTIVNDDPQPQTFSYTIGETVSNGQPAPGAGNIETSGSVDRYTFSAAASQAVFVKALGASNCALRWKLILPDGTGLERGICESQQLTFPTAGTHVLVVSAPDKAGDTGTYSFRITLVPEPQSFDYTIGAWVSNGQPGPGAGNIEVPGARDVYRFTAYAGQKVTINRISASDCGLVQVRITGPSRQVLGGWSNVHGSHYGCGESSQLFLPVAGAYAIEFDATWNTGGTYTYSFTTTSITQTFEYTLGTTVSNGHPWAGAGNIEVVGAEDWYSFNGAAGQKVLVDWIWASHCDRAEMRWRLIGPGDVTIFDQWGCGDPGQFTLPSHGTYKLIVDANPDTGVPYTYSFRIASADEVTVPLVREMSPDDAEAVLNEAGLQADFYGDFGPNAYVSSQSPSAGTKVAAGSTVTMELRSGPIP